jgi:hypothetical protein
MTEARVLQALPSSATAQTSIAVRPRFQAKPCFFPETISDQEGQTGGQAAGGQKSVARAAWERAGHVAHWPSDDPPVPIRRMALDRVGLQWISVVLMFARATAA